jgi:hypothetical protein
MNLPAETRMHHRDRRSSPRLSIIVASDGASRGRRDVAEYLRWIGGLMAEAVMP